MSASWDSFEGEDDRRVVNASLSLGESFMMLVEQKWEACFPMNYTVSNSFFAFLHKPLVLMFIYCK
jgi:hypothetical protein